jgi:hypothetical protein
MKDKQMAPAPSRFEEQLSAELRLMIFDLLVPGPRVVEFEWNKSIGWYCPRESASSPSILLSINRESRGYYLSKWLPLAPSKYSGLECQQGYRYIKKRNLQFLKGKAPMEVFNPKIDTLYIADNEETLGNMKDKHMTAIRTHPCIQQLQSLAIGQHFIKYLLPKYHFKLSSLIVRSFPSLTKLTLLGGDPHWSEEKNKYAWKGLITFKDPEKTHKKCFLVKYDANRADQFFQNIKSFLKHGEISGKKVTFEYKLLFRGGVNMNK